MDRVNMIVDIFWQQIINKIPEEEIDKYNVGLWLLTAMENEMKNVNLAEKREIWERVITRATIFHRNYLSKKIAKKAKNDHPAGLTQKMIEVLQADYEERMQREEDLENYLNSFPDLDLNLEVPENTDNISEFDFDDEPPF